MSTAPRSVTVREISVSIRSRHLGSRAILQLAKEMLVAAGSHLPQPALHRLQMVLNYMRLGRWMEQHGFRFPLRVRDRDKVFLTIAEKVRDKRVLYLEFGVFQGDSMRYWSRALKHPESMLHGFDSFEGLPEDWDESGHHQKGAYSAQGQIPVIDDPRVKFFKGWFDQVLPTYTVPDHEVLVVFMDADLYSSTICALRHLRLWIKPGTYIYFDDMSHPDHEPRAFDEFMEETGLRFAPVVANKALNYASFECVG